MKKRPASGMWHVIARGARRLEIFREKPDYTRFLDLLKAGARQDGIETHAYALMSNHYHLLLSGGSKALTSLMHRLNWSYARHHNATYELKGHVFEGSYHAFAQSTPAWAVRTSAYIHANPVAAGLAHRPEEYPWTSYAAYTGGGAGFLNVAPVLEGVDERPAAARRRYREIVQEEIDRSRTQDRKPNDVPTAEEVWRNQVLWIVETIRHGVPEDRLIRPMAAYVAHEAGVPLRAIAAALEYPNTNVVNAALFRLKNSRRRSALVAQIRQTAAPFLT